MEKNLPTMQETQVQSLGWEDPLEKGMATHSSIIAWRIPWTEEPGRLQSRGLKESDMTERLTHTHIRKEVAPRYFPLYTKIILQRPIVVYDPKNTDKDK